MVLKIQIMTIGSRGDVQPYVALGVGLLEAGYRVEVCSAESFQDFVLSHGLEFSPLPNDLVALLGQDEGRQAIEDMQGIFGAVKATARLFGTIKPIIKDLLTANWAAAESFQPDLIIYNSKLPGVHIAEKLDIPCVLAIPFPQLVVTKEMPTLGMPELGRFNRASYGVVRLAMSLYGGFINKFRTETLGLSKVSRFQGLHHKTNGETIPVFHCFSKHIVPRPADWPEPVKVTGYWFLKDTNEPPSELVEFLERGTPPVYVGFGSMSGRKTAKVTRTVIAALKRAKVRGVIATGWGGLDPGELPDSILRIEQAPHEWLFPRVSAVVHHGGAGTTAAGLRAGRPTVICPFFGDQPFWGKRIFDLGLGSKPIPQRKLDVENLSNAIKLVTSDESIRDEANKIGEKIRKEDGVANAVEEIRNMLS